MSLGPLEVAGIFILVLLIFGGKKIPELARGLGKGLREFKKAKEGITDSISCTIDDIEISETKSKKKKKKSSKKKKKKKKDKK